MFGIETLGIFSVASLNLAVMSWRVCLYLFMYYPVCIQHFLEHCRGQFPALIVSEIFRKCLLVIRLDTFNRVLEDRYRVFHKDCRRVTAVILKSLQIALPGILVYCGKLKQSNSLSHTFAGHDHVNAYSVDYQGVRLTYGLKSSRQFYYSEELVGGTLITLKVDTGNVSVDIEYKYVQL